MTSGLPDYRKGVRPIYGGAVLASGSKQVLANQGTQLAGVDGKGMIYGGSLWLDYTLTQANGEVMVQIDGDIITQLSFFRMLEYGITNPRTSLVTLNKYDPVNFVYSAAISFGVTFETSLTLVYNEQNGFTPTVHYRLLYALV